MVICWLNSHPKFSYEKHPDFILIALRFFSQNRVLYDRMYLAHTAVDIHIYVYVYKVKLSLSSGGMTPLILTSSLDRDEWSTSRTGHFTTGREPRNPLNGRLGGTKSLSGRFGRRENLFSLLEFESYTSQGIATRYRCVCLFMCIHICFAYLNWFCWSQYTNNI
jgi:hypothetical protein